MSPRPPALAAVVACFLLFVPSGARCQSSAADPLVVLGLSGGEVKINAPAPSLRAIFRLEARDDSVRSVRIDVPALVDVRGDLHPVTIRSGTLAARDTLTVGVPALGYTSIALEAELTASGEYWSSISLIRGGRRTTQLLKVIRLLDPSPVVIGLRPASTVIGPGEDAVVWLTLRDTSGKGATVRPPVVVDFHRLGDTLGTEYRRVRVLDEDGRPVTAPTTLSPGSGIRRLKLVFEGLTSPGNYAGSISVPGVGMRSSEAALTLAARRSWWCAALLILLGVVASAVIRHLAGPLRTRELQRARSARLREQIEGLSESLRRTGPLRDDEEEVLRGWRGRLPAVSAHEAGVGGEDPDALVNELTGKLALFGSWVESRRRVDALVPERLRDPLRQKLATVGTYLGSSAASETERAEAESILQAFPAEILGAQKQEALRQVDELAAAVQRARELRAADGELARTLGEFVLTPLSQVRAELEREFPDFETVAGSLNGVRHQFARVLAKTLAVDLEGAEKPRYYDGDWATLRSSVLVQLSGVETAATADEAMERYSAAQSTYLSSLVEEMAKDMGLRRTKLRARGLDAGELPRELERLNAERRAVDKQVALGDVHRAAGSFGALEAEYLALLDEIVRITEGGTLGRGRSKSTVSTLAVGVPGGVIGPGRLGPPSPGRRARARERTSAEIMTRIRHLDAILTVVGAIIATVLGLWLLYAGRATWGSMQDCLAAVLWGLGLHGLTANAGAGIQDVLSRISNPVGSQGA